MNELLLLLVLGVSIAGVVLIAMLITKERTSAREARDELNRIMSSFAGVQNAQFEALRGLDLPPSLALWIAGPLAGIALLSLNAWLSSRKVLRVSPALTLRDSV